MKLLKDKAETLSPRVERLIDEWRSLDDEGKKAAAALTGEALAASKNGRAAGKAAKRSIERKK